ncbi:MAG: hypothetical protein IJR62_04850 [Lachnospiraceae bacterium]|nr:hypothetical protein [Lachnospiraceae bacterium]
MMIKHQQIIHKHKETGRGIIALFLSLACAAALSIPAFAGYWANLADGSWVYWESHEQLIGWHWVDGNSDGTAECYYFGQDGKLVTGASVDGWQVNGDGAWIQDGVVQTQAVTPGSHHAAGSGNASGNTSGSGTVSYDGVVYTPALARAQHVSLTVMGTQAPYQGKVWSYDDYVYSRKEARETGKLYFEDRCMALGCLNPSIEGGNYCGVHTCKEPGCKSPVGLSAYNAGFCYAHMKSHGIDEYEFTKLENAQQKAARDAAAAAQAQSYGSGSSKSSSSSGSSKSSSGSSSGSAKSSGSSSGSSKSTGSAKGSSGSSSGKSSGKTSSYDSYDDGYDDVYYNEDYDIDRYNSDWDYMLGVDDALDDLGEDW